MGIIFTEDLAALEARVKALESNVADHEQAIGRLTVKSDMHGKLLDRPASAARERCEHGVWAGNACYLCAKPEQRRDFGNAEVELQSPNFVPAAAKEPRRWVKPIPAPEQPKWRKGTPPAPAPEPTKTAPGLSRSGPDYHIPAPAPEQRDMKPGDWFNDSGTYTPKPDAPRRFHLQTGTSILVECRDDRCNRSHFLAEADVIAERQAAQEAMGRAMRDQERLTDAEIAALEKKIARPRRPTGTRWRGSGR